MVKTYKSISSETVRGIDLKTNWMLSMKVNLMSLDLSENRLLILNVS